MKRWMFALSAALGLSAFLSAQDQTPAQEKPAMPATAAKSPLDFTMPSIDGKDVSLSAYRGKVVLMVNVASRCGLTPQYKQLEEVYQKYKDQGFVILGFPANDFMGQEPGTNEQIKDFCQSKYSVTFDMFSKISVKGDEQNELYKFLTSPDTNPKFAGDISWNFEKFLVGRDGLVVDRFSPRTKPDDAKVIAAIEAALKAAAPADKAAG